MKVFLYSRRGGGGVQRGRREMKKKENVELLSTPLSPSSSPVLSPLFLPVLLSFPFLLSLSPLPVSSPFLLSLSPLPSFLSPLLFHCHELSFGISIFLTRLTIKNYKKKD